MRLYGVYNINSDKERLHQITSLMHYTHDRFVIVGAVLIIEP